MILNRTWYKLLAILFPFKVEYKRHWMGSHSVLARYYRRWDGRIWYLDSTVIR